MIVIVFNFNSTMLSDMEDAHTHLLSLSNDNSAAFFAVYDGHGGKSFTLACLSNMI